MKVELGCGRHKREGYTGIDIQPFPGVDIVADVRNIPLPDECADEVYTSHVIEHFWWYEIKDLLAEWIRILKPGGLIVVGTPNANYFHAGYQRIDDISEVDVKNGLDDHAMLTLTMLYGNDRNFNQHKCLFNFNLLQLFLKDAEIISTHDAAGHPRDLVVLGIKPDE